MNRITALVFTAAILALAPITFPDVKNRLLHYVRPTPPAEVSVLFVGDVMLSRMVAKRMNQYGPDYPFASVKELVSGVDIAFGNLETAITVGPDVQAMEMSFRADAHAAPALRDAGFDILSLANNHTPDFGPQGVIDTLEALDGVGLLHVGAGRSDTEAGQPMFVTSRGIVFAFLAYNDSRIVSTAYGAAEDRAGTSFMNIEQMRRAVQGAHNFADIVIVSMHAGNEYQATSTIHQQAFAHAAIDAGADIVIGHHPHVVQEAELYKDKYIFYSLGNFVFDQMWSDDTMQGLALEVVFRKNGLSRITYHPVNIEDYAKPRPLEGPKALSVISRLGPVGSLWTEGGSEEGVVYDENH